MDTATTPPTNVAPTDADLSHAAVPEAEEAGSEPPSGVARLTSVDAYRGFVMLLMASEGLGIPQVAKTFSQSRFWQFMGYEFDHVKWIGCALWDLIQPSFSFLVGVSLPYSIAARRDKGQTYGQMFRHALFRSLALIFLGIFLRSMGKPQSYFTFEDTLTQIGLGYLFLFILANKPIRTQMIAAGGLLFVYWLAFLLYPLPPANFDYNSVGVRSDWEHLSGMAAHWDKNTNFASAFDQWFLNLFPREKPFVYNGGGYLTLSFIPTLATMIFGLLAGGLLKSERPSKEKVRILVTAGIAGLVIGWTLGLLGICPVVKRIWTPSWAIFSGGWCCLLLSAFYHIVDLKGRRKWAFPLVVVGMNSIAMYLFAHIFPSMIEKNLKTHLGQNVFEHLGGVYAPILEASAVLFVLWLMCYWMYKRKVFLRI